jgi:hypothetical protein
MSHQEWGRAHEAGGYRRVTPFALAVGMHVGSGRLADHVGEKGTKGDRHLVSSLLSS